MLGIILICASIIIIVVCFFVAAEREEFGGITIGLVLLSAAVLCSPLFIEYADVGSYAIEYKPTGELVSISDSVIRCTSHCANVPEAIKLDEVRASTTASISALGPLKITWQVNVRPVNFKKVAGIFAGADKQPKTWAAEAMKGLIEKRLAEATLVVEQRLHVLVGFGNTNVADLGGEIKKTIQPRLEAMGLEAISVDVAVSLR